MGGTILIPFTVWYITYDISQYTFHTQPNIKYLASTLVCAFLITPFLGKKIAYDKEFQKKYIPDWYFYGLEKPENAWTKEELNQEIIILQRRLHERAIAGDITPEELEEMRRSMWKPPEKESHAHFAQLHPGVDADEDIEDEE